MIRNHFGFRLEAGADFSEDANAGAAFILCFLVWRAGKGAAVWSPAMHTKVVHVNPKVRQLPQAAQGSCEPPRCQLQHPCPPAQRELKPAERVPAAVDGAVPAAVGRLLRAVARQPVCHLPVAVHRPCPRVRVERTTGTLHTPSLAQKAPSPHGLRRLLAARSATPPPYGILYARTTDRSLRKLETTVSRSDIRLIQHLDSSALGLVRRWRLIGYSLSYGRWWPWHPRRTCPWTPAAGTRWPHSCWRCRLSCRIACPSPSSQPAAPRNYTTW
jgi:hypothetical protein